MLGEYIMPVKGIYKDYHFVLEKLKNMIDAYLKAHK
jgi:hypothetical protein